MNLKKKCFQSTWVCTIVSVLLLCISSYSQVQEGSTKPEQPSSCEHVTMFLDDAIQRVQKSNDPHSPLIVIFQLGKSEKNTALNSSRIKLVDYSIKRRKALLRFVLATSPEPADGLGRADIYVGGQLIYSLYFGANAKQCEVEE